MLKSVFIPMGYSIQLSGTQPQTAEEEELEETEDAEEEGTNQLLLVFTTE